MPEDAYGLEVFELEDEVQKAIQGAVNARDAEEKIANHFFSGPRVNVQELSDQCFMVAICPYVGAETYSFTCYR